MMSGILAKNWINSRIHQNCVLTVLSYARSHEHLILDLVYEEDNERFILVIYVLEMEKIVLNLRGTLQVYDGSKTVDKLKSQPSWSDVDEEYIISTFMCINSSYNNEIIFDVVCTNIKIYKPNELFPNNITARL